MRVVELAEIVQMDAAEIVPCVRGVVKAMYPRKEGVAKTGKPWSIESFLLAMNGGEIKVCVWNRDLLDKRLKGQPVIISCKEGDKGNSGLYVDENTYQGKTTKQLKVTETGIIELASPEIDQPTTTAPAAPPAQAAQAVRAPAAQATLPAASTHGTDEQVTRAARKWLAEKSNLLLACFAASRYISDEYGRRHNAELPPAELGLNARTLYIDAQRSGIAMPPVRAGQTPAPATAAKAPPPPKPAPEPEPEQEPGQDDCPF